MDFLQTLVQKGLLREDEIPGLGALSKESDTAIEEALLEKGINEEVLMRAKGEYYRMPVRVLEGDVSREVLKYIPSHSARHYRFAPLAIKDGVLEIGIIDPDNIEAMDALQFISTRIKMPIKVYLISGQSFQKIVGQYNESEEAPTFDLSEEEEELVPLPQVQQEPHEQREEGGSDALGDSATKKSIQKKTNNELLGYAKRVSPDEKNDEKNDEKKEIHEENAPVSKMVTVILRNAVEGGASDIHIEHIGDKIRVRFRIDGDLHTSIVLPKTVHAAIVSRIKILTNLKLDEKRKPQDGRFSVKVDGRRIDFRVSTYPAYFGEKVVMRILDSEKSIQTISEIGLRETDYKKIKRLIKRPYGLILLTGPTGSGKSTTLYSMLNELDRDLDNIVSLEDPVEYQIEGVNQSNVRPEIDYTFATGLRSILRQDPDIIMVGEIRDKETAQLAIQAALTGHLVFSTLHTNTAAGVVPRLIDMGVDPYLIAPTLLVAIGQRLCAKLCDEAGKKIPVDEAMRVMIEKEIADLPEEYRGEIKIPEYVYEAAPTSDCPTGLRGRQAVFEVFEVTPEIRHTVLTGPVENEVFKVARRNGMLTMKEDALLKAFAGKIPFVEVNKL